MDLWIEGVNHPSPIRIDHVKPLGSGQSELELAFCHLCYPEGVKDKVYRLKVLKRTEHELFAIQFDVGEGGTLRIAPLTRDWLARHIEVPALLALASGDEADLSEGLDAITRGGARPELTVPFYLADDVGKTMIHCALRFDGYAWLEAAKLAGEEKKLDAASERLLRDLTLDVDLEVNFAALFFLQRFLGKWGGEMLPPADRHHTAYRFLFLHVHAKPTPARWINAEYERLWQNTPAERIVLHAATIRRRLLAPKLRSS